MSAHAGQPKHGTGVLTSRTAPAGRAHRQASASGTWATRRRPARKACSSRPLCSGASLAGRKEAEAVTAALPASRPKGSPGWRRERPSWPPHGLQAPHAPALEEGPLPSDDNCISLIISMQPGHGTSWDPSCCSNVRINDLGTEKHSEPWIDFQRREARGRCERASQAWEGKFNPERH